MWKKLIEKKLSLKIPTGQQQLNILLLLMGKSLVKFLVVGKSKKEFLLEWGGHIGYGVAPDFRGHHFAEEMVRFVLPKYRKRKISQVMISATKIWQVVKVLKQMQVFWKIL